MPTAPDFNHPGYWHRRAEQARALAQQMSNEKAKETMLMVAADCDRFAVRAAMRSLDEIRRSHSIAISGDAWPDDARLSDIEERFTCRVCGKRGADVRPDFNRDRKPKGGMGYR